MSDVVNAHPAAWLVVSLLGVLGPLVWVAGIVPVIALVRERGWVLTTVGGYLTAIGLVAGVGHLALFFGLAGELAASGIDQGATDAIQGADAANPISNLLLVVFLVGFALGPIILTIGLRRAKLVPVWVPVAAIIAAVANFVGGVPAGIVQLLALVATFGVVLLVLARGAAFGVRAVSTAP